MFFANSGAEANEGAIKVARKYAADKYGKDRYQIITLTNSFHGRTIATLEATGQDHFHQNFFPFTNGFVYTPANDIDALKEAVNDQTAAIMVELIQGESGVRPWKPNSSKRSKNFVMKRIFYLSLTKFRQGLEEQEISSAIRTMIFCQIL